MLAQAGVGLMETYFAGKLGTDARWPAWHWCSRQ